MTKAAYFKSLVFLFRFGAIYMVGEALVYLSSIRLSGLSYYWPEGAVFFLQEYMLLWGAASAFLACLLFRIQKNPKRHTAVIKTLSPFCILLALVLAYMSRVPFNQLLPTPAANLWLPDYSFILRVEALLLLLVGLFLYYGKQRKYLQSDL